MLLVLSILSCNLDYGCTFPSDEDLNRNCMKSSTFSEKNAS